MDRLRGPTYPRADSLARGEVVQGEVGDGAEAKPLDEGVAGRVGAVREEQYVLRFGGQGDLSHRGQCRAGVATAAEVWRGVGDGQADLARDHRVHADHGDGGAVRGLPQRYASGGDARVRPPLRITGGGVAVGRGEVVVEARDFLAIFGGRDAGSAFRYLLGRNEGVQAVEALPLVKCWDSTSAAVPGVRKRRGGVVVCVDAGKLVVEVGQVVSEEIGFLGSEGG